MVRSARTDCHHVNFKSNVSFVGQHVFVIVYFNFKMLHEDFVRRLLSLSGQNDQLLLIIYQTKKLRQVCRAQRLKGLTSTNTRYLTALPQKMATISLVNVKE